MTKRIKLTDDPIQVSDGSKEAHITASTSRTAKLYYCESIEKPSKEDFHVLLDHAMSIPKGWSIWVWNFDTSTEVILGFSEKTYD